MDSFVGDIRMFAGNYAPEGYALCDGRLLSIAQYQGLYSLIGTIYGGDGITTFALPDLRGRLPVGQGKGPDLTPRTIGQALGTEEVKLAAGEMPSHTHTLLGSLNSATANSPVSNLLGQTSDNFYDDGAGKGKVVEFKNGAVNSTAKSTAHNNVMPSLCINFIIALTGVYPLRPN